MNVKRLGRMYLGKGGDGDLRSDKWSKVAIAWHEEDNKRILHGTQWLRAA